MVGICKYTDQQIQFIVVAKKYGCTNREIAMAFHQNWPFAKDVTSGSVKYVVSKYQDDPLYNNGQLPQGLTPPSIGPLCQGTNASQMTMHPHPSQGMGQMVMRPQQPQIFTQQMMHPQQHHGHASSKMGIQQSHRVPQLMNGPQQVLNPAPATIGIQQHHHTQKFAMPAHQAAGGPMSSAQVLSFAHSHMTPAQFVAFARALTQPTGLDSAVSPQAAEAPVSPIQPQVVGGAFTPAMAIHPGNSAKDKSESTIAESPKQGYMPSTPAMASPKACKPSSPAITKAQEAINTAVLMTPQHSQGPTGGMTSPQQCQVYSQDMRFPQQLHSFDRTSPQYAQAYSQVPIKQSQGFARGMSVSQQHPSYNQTVPGVQQQFLAQNPQSMSNEQSQVLFQSSGVDQHASPTATNQAPLITQGLQCTMPGSTAEVTNTAVTMSKKVTPYLGIVPPARRNSQSNQLGMLHKFVARSPLSPVTSAKTRVTKNSSPKSAAPNQAKTAAIEAAVIQVENPATELAIRQVEDAMTEFVVYPAENDTADLAVHPQLPESPGSQTNQIINNDDHEVIIIDDEMEASAEEAINTTFAGIDEAYPYGIAPEMEAEFDSLRAEVDALFEDPTDVQETSTALPETGDLSLPDIMNSVDSIDEPHIMGLDAPEIVISDKVWITEEGKYYHSSLEVDEPLQEVFHVAMTRYIAEMQAKRTGTDGAATENDNHGIASDDVELVEDDPKMRVATPEEIDLMTPLEEYCYGIRQGLPNKGYPMKQTVQNAFF